MMASNIVGAEAGGYPEQTQTDTWWLTKWSSWLATIGAVFLAFIGSVGVVLNLLTIDFLRATAAGFQVGAAALILAIEGSSVVAFLTFAKPVGMIFEGRPLYVKTTVYAGLTIIPMLLSPSGMVIFGFLISASITAMYAMILVGKKGSLDSMRAAAVQPTI